MSTATPDRPLVEPEETTVTLQNGLSSSLPANSPLAKLLRTQRTWIGPSA